MITSAIQRFAYDVGFDIGQGSDDCQAALFHGLAHGLSSIRSGAYREM